MMDWFSLKFILDIIIVGFIVYQLVVIIKGTRAMSVFLGLAIVAVLFALAGVWKLTLTEKVLSYFFEHLVLIIVVLFQEEIRRTLADVGRKVSSLSNKKGSSTEEISANLSRVAFQMGSERLGGLIVLEREDKLTTTIETGSPIFAKVRPELIYALFLHKSPLHDGAIIISKGELVSAGCVIPNLSKNPNLNKQYGTRHRAGIGLTEETDALVIVISEETGNVSIVNKGKISTGINEQELREMLTVLLEENVIENSLLNKGLKFLSSLKKKK